MIFFNRIKMALRLSVCFVFLFVLAHPALALGERSVSLGATDTAQDNPPTDEASVSVMGEGASLRIKGFPGASLEASSRQHADDYLVALGTYRKIRGLWRVEELRLRGDLQRKTFRLPDNHTPREGFLFVTKQLQQYPLRELFVCESRDCGESNSWANNHFNILQLYGLDQYQYYGAYEVMLPGTNGVYVTVYAVLRGNKRVYLQLEVLRRDAPEAR
ncbi:DUF4892 domain-containing protein [Gilvimarinus japonicus]